MNSKTGKDDGRGPGIAAGKGINSKGKGVFTPCSKDQSFGNPSVPSASRGGGKGVLTNESTATKMGVGKVSGGGKAGGKGVQVPDAEKPAFGA